MSRPSRIFVAVPVPPDRAEKLQRLQTLIAPTFPGARWVEPDKFHVTLAFLGDVPDESLNALCLGVASAVRGFHAPALTIRGLGVFPGPIRPRVVWAGLEGEDLDSFAEVQQAVARACTDLGFSPEDNRFSPHITLGRMKPKRDQEEDDCTPLLRHHERWRGGPMIVDHVATYASQFVAEGPTYVTLGRAPLRGR